MIFRVFKNNNAKIIAIIAAAAAAAAIVVGIAIAAHSPQLPPEVAARLVVVAEKDSMVGVERDSGFFVRGPEAISAAAFKNRLSIVPAMEYELKQHSDNELYLKPAGDLEADTIYNILIADNSYEPPLSWAFQTRNAFRVNGTHPVDEGSYVPVTSGIEFYFSQPVDDIGKYVTVSPELAGKYEQLNDKTVVFIPKDGMEDATEYTVTLAAGLPSRAGDTLQEEYSFSFTTELSAGFAKRLFYAYDGISETFTSTDPIFIKLHANSSSMSSMADREMSVEIYRYPGLDDYMAALSDSREKDGGFLPTKGLAKITGYTDALLMDSESYWDVAFLPVPENPGQGWYLVDIQSPSSDKHAQKLLQITDIAVYSQTANGQMLFWLNDAGGGQPIAGANISVEGQEALSDQNGLALIDIPMNEAVKNDKHYDDYYYYYYSDYHRGTLHTEREVRIRHNGQMYGEFLDFYGEKEIPFSKLYYTYVYTDRAAYQPNDTVHFWGMISPRASDSARPERIALDWKDGGKYPDGISVDVQADGSFRGEIKLENYVSGWAPLIFTLDGRLLVRSYLTVLEYVKPVYTMDVELDKEYYRRSEQVNATVSAGFYDGTPARDVGLSLSYANQGSYKESAAAELSTDENGKAQASFSPQDGDSWQPRHDSIYGCTISAEDEPIYFDQTVLFFPSDYMLRCNAKRSDGGFALSLESYNIDFGRVDSGEYKYGDNAKLRGDKADISGTGTIYRVEYVKNKIGEYYDFINKVTVDRYEYDRRETIVETFPIETENGSFTSQPFEYPEGKLTSYFIKLNYTAPDGGKYEETCMVQGYRNYGAYRDRNFKSYYFRQSDAEQASDDDDYFSYHYNYYYPSGRYGLNEKIEMRLYDQDDQVPTQGRILYTVLGRELLSYATANGGSFSVNFTEEYAPNAEVLGAYFDGKHIFSVSSSSLLYRYMDSALNIDAAPDKERYQPGDEAVLNLRVTGPDGRGTAANFLLSVVDEAAFAVREQYLDPLQDVYNRYFIDYAQYASYKQPYETDSGAESGEGGSDSVRKEFLDTVAFLSGQTDADGEAVLKFKLPDNITSWRLTGIAFSENMGGGLNIPLVGKDVSNVESGLPFFINQVLNEKYIAGDSVGLSLRGAGSAIKSGDVVSYDVSLSGGGADTDTQKNLQGPATEYCLLDFGRLPVGKYNVLIRASCGDYRDALEKEFEVVDSLLLTSRETRGDLAEGLSISAKRFPVSITLYDTANKLYYDILHQMLYADGERADQKIARALAGKRLNEINEDSCHPETPELGSEAAYSMHGLRLFPYSEEDVLLTAKAAAVAPEFFSADALSDFFTRVIKDEDSAFDVAAAYMGLGALKKPVLLDLRKLFEEARESEDFALEEKLHLAAGLALLGDSGAARDWYEEAIHGELAQEGNSLSYNQSGDQHYDYMMTASAAMLACLINHPDHQPLLSYVTTHYSTTYAPLLELAVYVGKYSPRPDSPAAFSYRLAGETVRHEFDKQRYLHLELGEAQLAEAGFQVLDGSVSYTAHYSGGLDEAEKALPGGVGFDRRLSAESVGLNDAVTVTSTITFGGEAPGGHYRISQIVPSGFRLVRVNDQNSFDNNWYCLVGESGMLDFYVFPARGYLNSDIFNRIPMPRSVTFSYEIKAVLPGSYVVEAPAISYSGSNTLYAGERGRLDVEE